jgi:site-specific recombinase XerD
MLEAGTDALTVSALLGHADGAMLAQVYSHLSKNDTYLKEAVRVVAAPSQTPHAPAPRSAQ